MNFGSSRGRRHALRETRGRGPASTPEPGRDDEDPDLATTLELVRLAAAGEGLAPPRASARREGRTAIAVRFAGCASLQLRTDAGDWRTWSLWLGVVRIGVYETPARALAEARRWLGGMAL